MSEGYYYAARAREMLREEALPGVVLPWTGAARELARWVRWLLTLPRSRWPVADPSPLWCMAQAVAVAARRLSGSGVALTPAEAERLVLDVATGRHAPAVRQPDFREGGVHAE